MLTAPTPSSTHTPTPPFPYAVPYPPAPQPHPAPGAVSSTPEAPVSATVAPPASTSALTPETLAALQQTGLYPTAASLAGLQLFPVPTTATNAPVQPPRFWRMVLWRTLVVVLAGSSAFLGGSILAEKAIGESLFSLPGVDHPPAVTTLWQQSSRLLRMGQRLPKAVTTALTALHPTEPAATDLTPAQRQQLQADLSQLQVELDNLTLRTAVLEAQLDGKHPSLPLEQRLDRLAQADAPATRGRFAASWQALTNPDRFTITLPSDALFTPGDSTLRSESLPILASISADLRRHAGATIQIAVHTDDLGTTVQNRELSLQQAQTIADYLGTVLGDRYRWVLVGYGESAPLTPNQTDSDRQRNRRLEIAIVE